MQGKSASEHSSAELQETQNKVATLQSRAEALSERLAESEVKTWHSETDEGGSAAKLDTTEEELAVQNDLKSAKLELGDLVATRNLHIVMFTMRIRTGNGPLVWASFLVEGNHSFLCLYLDAPGQFKANVVFHVWVRRPALKSGA